MNTFIKTFLICLIACLGFLFYQFLGENSYSPELKLSESSNNFFHIAKENNNIQKEYNKQENITKEEETKNTLYQKQTEEYNKKEIVSPKKIIHTHSCYFFSKNGELTEIQRESTAKPTLESVITLLLKGPLISESKNGIYSEIPPNVDLISIKNSDNSIIVNLSSNFGNGGGSKSVENRVLQISKTIKKYHPKKSVYLHINGKEVEYLGGEGIYIKQPLE